MSCTNLFFINPLPQIKHIFYNPYIALTGIAMPWKIIIVSKIWKQPTQPRDLVVWPSERREAGNYGSTACHLRL